MPLVSRKGILAIAAVLDVALHARSRPVSAKALVEAVRAFSTALGRISVEDMAKRAAALK
jgi:hypothetical protein